MAVPVPSEMKLERHGLTVRWPDGHKSLYPYKYLRIRCQCAQCVEEWSRVPLLDPDTVPEGVAALDLMEVGRYAVQFLWSDGHFTGIYPFERLRETCPCPECRTKQLTPPKP